MTRREAPIAPPVVCTIAGSDSGGGAGIQADLKTIEACGGFGTSAITSVTAQNTQGVHGSHLLPLEDIDAQIEAVRSDFDVAAVKTGMLATNDVVDLVTEHAEDLPNLVVDPVMVAATGDRLLAEEAEAAYETLIAEATLVTPNADEAEVLTDVTVDDPAAAERAGRILVDEIGADAALVKGGHVPSEHVLDTLVTAGTIEAADDAAGVLTDDTTVTTFRHDRVETDATHGSGCTLSSAIATHLAHGDDLATAVGAGIDLLSRAVRYTVDVGEGPGAVHHLVELRNDASHQATVELVAMLAERVNDRGDRDTLVPATGLGLVGATPHAEEQVDVAGLTGRSTTGETVDATSREIDDPIQTDRKIEFGGDEALASVLLAVREMAPGIRFAALVASERSRFDDFDHVTLTVDGLTEYVEDTDPIRPTALDAITSAERPPAAIVPDRQGAGDDRLAIVVGETTNELFDRLANIAA